MDMATAPQGKVASTPIGPLHSADDSSVVVHMDSDSPVDLSGFRDHRPIGLQIPRRRRWGQEPAKLQQPHKWYREHIQMTRRDGTSWTSGSGERIVQVEVAAAVSVIWTSQEPASIRLEMLEHAVISAAATVYELQNTQSTCATFSTAPTR